METNGDVVRPTAEQALAALAETERVSASTAAVSATPWPRWFVAVLTLYVAAIPPVYGGTLADHDWLLSRSVWSIVMTVMTAVFLALFAVAASAWRRRTGVALRFDVLPKRATVPLVAGLPVVLIGSAFVFRATHQPLWLLAASVIGATVSVAFHLVFVRLHRKAS
ncbi:hypothetical protein ACF068_26465 [Streptomyces sp. NPDC016309]|uniref:hypothetical protein n=1 Tax=Streptomyces sp. NPDC016309 TaxID=3364965 RepID=UPI0037007D52